jgi:hypothetical protein
MSRKWIIAWAGLAFLAGIACATSHAFVPETGSCTTAADCEVTGFTGCCACAVEPRAVNRGALAKRTDICTVVECKCASDCQCGPVADPRTFEAACTHGHCEAIRR